MFWAVLIGRTRKNIWSTIDCQKLKQIKEKSAKNCLRNKRQTNVFWLTNLNQDFQIKNLDNILVCCFHFLSSRGNIRLISLRDNSPKNDNYLIIYSPSRHPSSI
ncbi:Sensor histidine kinase DpiB [Labeo rohita]|uniref:Sensor histidine kinase DpiB n=1 Tax=Labeo rohita TaxID=84645 RepID=A0ABQ8MC58_LABRO|nr:Sensor histidine kinase DpiB [Labeo rohita]